MRLFKARRMTVSGREQHRRNSKQGNKQSRLERKRTRASCGTKAKGEREKEVVEGCAAAMLPQQLKVCVWLRQCS